MGRHGSDGEIGCCGHPQGVTCGHVCRGGAGRGSARIDADIQPVARAWRADHIDRLAVIDRLVETAGDVPVAQEFRAERDQRRPGHVGVVVHARHQPALETELLCDAVVVDAVLAFKGRVERLGLIADLVHAVIHPRMVSQVPCSCFIHGASKS